MNNFFTGRRIVVGLLLGVIVIISAFVLVSMNMTFFQSTLFNVSNVQEERSPEEVKELGQNLTTFKNSGICARCDLGKRGFGQEGMDLRQTMQLVRSKGLPIDLSQSNLCDVNLSGVNLSGANLSGALLLGANLTDADLTGANLSGASLGAAKLQGANLTGANLRGVELVKSDLRNANLTNVDLTRASFVYTRCNGAIFTGADLRGALIYSTDLTHVEDLAHAKFDGAFVSLLRLGGYFLLMVGDKICIAIKRLIA